MTKKKSSMDKRNLKLRKDTIRIPCEFQKCSHPKLIAEVSISHSFCESFKFINWYDNGHLYRLVTFLVKVLRTLWRTQMIMFLCTYLYGSEDVGTNWDEFFRLLISLSLKKKIPRFPQPNSFLRNWALLTLRLALWSVGRQVLWVEGHWVQLAWVMPCTSRLWTVNLTEEEAWFMLVASVIKALLISSVKLSRS